MEFQTSPSSEVLNYFGHFAGASFVWLEIIYFSPDTGALAGLSSTPCISVPTHIAFEARADRFDNNRRWDLGANAISSDGASPLHGFLLFFAASIHT